MDGQDRLLLQLLREPEPAKAPKTVYTPEQLLALEHSPLVPPTAHWLETLPSADFYRLVKRNNRRADPEDRRSQRARQKENKRRGRTTAQSTLSIADEPPQGDSVKDFEIWRLKMRMETARRSGQAVSPDDQAAYDALTKAEEVETPAPAETAPPPVFSADDQFGPAAASPAPAPAAAVPRASHFAGLFADASAQTQPQPAQTPSTRRSSRLAEILPDAEPRQTLPQTTPQQFTFAQFHAHVQQQAPMPMPYPPMQQMPYPVQYPMPMPMPMQMPVQMPAPAPVPNMPANHPLAMLLSKNKRKSQQPY